MDGLPSHVTRHVRSVEGSYLTLSEVARALRIPKNTLITWRARDPISFRPTMTTAKGGITISLYDLAALERIRLAAEARPGITGRRRLWTAAEGIQRQHEWVKASYHARRARTASTPEERKAAARNSRAIRAQLRQETRRRRRDLGLD